jgi:hypothetical protein
VQRLAFVHRAHTDDEQWMQQKEALQRRAQQLTRLRSSTLAALRSWTAPLVPPQPRQALVAACESLAWTPELCRLMLPLRPSCYPLLAQVRVRVRVGMGLRVRVRVRAGRG